MKKNLIIMYAIAFLQGMVFYGPIATLYRQAHGVTIFEITAIESISLALEILLEVPWGILADRIGYRKTMVSCSGLYFVSKIVFWKATGFAGFLIERVMLSVVMAGISGVDSSIIYLSCEGKNSQKAFGIYNSIGMAGLLTAAAVFSLFIKDHYSLAGLLTVISYGLAAVLSLGLTEVKHKKMVKVPSESFRGILKQT
ncbi:MAG: MFS transporter, partial [Candidatus Limiplasma sp.]|nr:MFS transporter [Candidatus Limiplasma sp.]